MKKFAKYLVPAILVGMVMLLAGCGDTVVSNDKSAGVYGTLQGKLMDAVTGKPITDAAQGDTKVYLVKGDQQVPADKLNTFIPAGSTLLPGEFAINNIPVTNGAINGGAIGTENAKFKVVVVKAGYQPFEAEFAFDGAYNVDKQYGTQRDTTYNKIGNIYLFPLGVTAPDYTVTVKFNGKAVANATVQLQQTVDTPNSASTPVQGGVTNFGLAGGFDTNRLVASMGLYPTLTATTDANGQAVFTGSTLTLGGAYNPVVLPCKDSDGVQLARKMGAAFVVGVHVGVASEISQTIVPDTLWAGDNVNGLYIASISTATGTAGGLVSSGALTVKFSRPVELNNSATANNVTTVTAAGVTTVTGITVYGYYAALTSTAVNPAQAADLTYALFTDTTTAARKPVAATLSADGLTLTLTPTIRVAVANTDYDLKVTYSGSTVAGATYQEPTINAKGFPEKQYTLFGSSGTQLLKANGLAIAAGERVVNMTGPRL